VGAIERIRFTANRIKPLKMLDLIGLLATLDPGRKQIEIVVFRS
jgi:hypothetical protein